MIILFYIIWYLIGLVTLIVKETSESDLRVSDLPIILLCAFGGPAITAIILISLMFTSDRILIKRRDKR